ncbi:hypothetical protein CLAIMM_10074 [Cladophialophora immunda]|nr:hypothetical protein CLAIMM_10074 [Cladophialophora immunda]
MSGNESSADNATGNPTASSSPATDSEKRDLVGLYALLFSGHFKRFKDEPERMEFINTEVLYRARFRRSYPSIRAMHADYDLMLPRYLAHSPNVLERVGDELNKFAEVEDYWWPKCVHLPRLRQLGVIETARIFSNWIIDRSTRLW